MDAKISKYQLGQKVTCNGNKQGRILRYYSGKMVEVRLWDNLRHVGDVVVSEHDLNLENR